MVLNIKHNHLQFQNGDTWVKDTCMKCECKEGNTVCVPECTIEECDEVFIIVYSDYVITSTRCNRRYPANTERFENVFRRFLFGPLRPKRF